MITFGTHHRIPSNCRNGTVGLLEVTVGLADYCLSSLLDQGSAGESQGRGGEEELGTELYSQKFPINKQL